MKYRYSYRNRENAVLDGEISAKNRANAYELLRAQGIKPIRVDGRDPVAWKRWAAIAVLSVVLAVVCLELRMARKEVRTLNPNSIMRAQIYGDEAILQHISANGWRASFADEGDAWLARHAIPGSWCDCNGDKFPKLNLTPIAIDDAEAPEFKAICRMINGMKSELAEYLASDGNERDYQLLCCERLKTERGIVDSTRTRLELLKKSPPADMAELWEKENKTLRSLGLPTIRLPEEE